MNKYLIGAIGVLLAAIIAVGAYAAYPKPEPQTDLAATSLPAEQVEETTPAETATTSSSSQPATASPGSYTMADVAAHNSRTSCYTAINGNVYNLTSWITQHPGGQEAILSLCGKDGSAAFNTQHGGERRPANELAGFKIGVIAK
jgi:cytochrome b involved in lipid metabolism